MRQQGVGGCDVVAAPHKRGIPSADSVLPPIACWRCLQAPGHCSLSWGKTWAASLCFFSIKYRFRTLPPRLREIHPTLQED